ncbi:MAG: helix-turn-helix domain-containing protein [Anaerolineales bacterium]|nr:helix-turn-helix domain-containing protein [Anaerolineales bacterium]
MEEKVNDILTLEETAELLRIPRSTVYKLAREGKIPAQKVGRHWRFHRETLINWVAGQPVIEGNITDSKEYS